MANVISRWNHLFVGGVSAKPNAVAGEDSTDALNVHASAAVGDDWLGAWRPDGNMDALVSL
ncbi:hypothetical protein [Nonomuraea sp. B1E8]|uniref:hypothetical protein n=1 Tax=unclassified Nonomuraea TaxID=2593643 RepID=UPI00325E72DB